MTSTLRPLGERYESESLDLAQTLARLPLAGELERFGCGGHATPTLGTITVKARWAHLNKCLPGSNLTRLDVLPRAAWGLETEVLKGRCYLSASASNVVVLKANPKRGASKFAPREMLGEFAISQVVGFTPAD